jgi:hypothetical protein
MTLGESNMKHYKNIHTNEEVTLDTLEKIERFFDNRCPSHWVETEAETEEGN